MPGPIYLSRDLGYLRVGVASPRVRLADVDSNVEAILQVVKGAAGRGVQALCFPEMGVTGYTIGDLVHQRALLAKAREGLDTLRTRTADSGMVMAVGLPLEVDGKVFNCAAVLHEGNVLGIVPKSLLPNYREFYEGRYWAPARDAVSDSVDIFGEDVPFGTDLLFHLEGLQDAVLGVEICEDLWLPLAPHEEQALAGATVLFNLSASNEILGKADWRRTMIASESGRCLAAYCYTSGGMGESSNDIVYRGHSLIAENGVILVDAQGPDEQAHLLVADIDVEKLAHDRRVTNSFHDRTRRSRDFRIVTTRPVDPPAARLERPVDAHPFVPADSVRRSERCREVFSMLVGGLAQKLSGSSINRVVIGVSGGLDSTLALLVAAKTADSLGLPRENIHAMTMPGFGTTSRTRTNAMKLCATLSIPVERVDIRRSAKSHLADLSHGRAEDLVFENVQARYRTELLFNKANQVGGLVLGTGDLTEVALGWSTFAGDQISHYHVSSSVPKTLVKCQIEWEADEELKGMTPQKELHNVLATPISPELLRPKNGVIAQMTEDLIGPIELADFFLYPFIRFGARPGKMLYMADQTRQRGLFDHTFTLEELHRWERSFLIRFFANQFKRTLFPEGPKIGSVSLSPRGDWRMPSDAKADVWLADLDEMYGRLMS